MTGELEQEVRRVWRCCHRNGKGRVRYVRSADAAGALRYFMQHCDDLEIGEYSSLFFGGANVVVVAQEVDLETKRKHIGDAWCGFFRINADRKILHEKIKGGY